VQYLTLNGYKRDDPTGIYSVTVTKDCYSANNGAFDKVAVQVNRKPKMTGFLGYFGVTWTSGAKAAACVGRSTNPGVIFPFAMSADSSCFDQTVTPPQPILGAACIIRNVGSTNGNLRRAQHGSRRGQLLDKRYRGQRP